MNYPKFVIYTNAEGRYFFRLYNDREKQLLTGHPCEQREQCITAIRQLYAAADKDHHYRIQTVRGAFFYQVTNLHQRVIATSVMYCTMAGMAYGIHGVKKNVCVAVIEDCRTIPV